MTSFAVAVFIGLVSGIGLGLRVGELLSKDRAPEDTKSRYVFDTVTQVVMFTWAICVLWWGDL